MTEVFKCSFYRAHPWPLWPLSSNPPKVKHPSEKAYLEKYRVQDLSSELKVVLVVLQEVILGDGDGRLAAHSGAGMDSRLRLQSLDGCVTHVRSRQSSVVAMRRGAPLSSPRQLACHGFV